jgi:hypothetical protein
MWFRVTVTLAIALLVGIPAFACVVPGIGPLYPPTLPTTATSAYRDGNYVLAANIAEANGTTESLAFAARARNADAVTRDGGLCLECLARAEKAAQAATVAATSPGLGVPDWLTLKPALAQAYVQLAIAIGLRGRLLSATEAQAEGLAEKGRAAIDRALELDPQNIWARGSLGGWHLEIVRRGGPVLASVLYGASEQEGLKNLRAAFAKDAGNLLLGYHFALSILALDPERFRAEALAALKSSETDATDDALTAFTRKRADKLINLLNTGTAAEIEALVRKFQGYPPEN